MDFSKEPESKNYTDTTGDPWYAPNKLMAAITIGMNRVRGDAKQKTLDKVQATRDANPIPKMTSDQIIANLHSKVAPTQGGWNVKTPGKIFDEFIPSIVPTPYTRGKSQTENSGLRPEEMDAIEHLFRKIPKKK